MTLRAAIRRAKAQLRRTGGVVKIATDPPRFVIVWRAR